MDALRKKITIFIVFIVISLMTSCIEKHKEEAQMQVTPIDLSKYSSEKPDQPLHLLFIHHSCGGQLFADKGEDVGENCIYQTHPNGGGLRRLLAENNYIVHEASYGSFIGADTDICHWNKKFRDDMDKVLTCKQQDESFEDETRNSIVVFKSCYPNSWLESDGEVPGDPDSCEKTTANYKATYRSLLSYFKEYPQTLFVVMSAPPLVKPVMYKRDRLINSVKNILGRSDTVDKVGLRTREFNNWLKDMEHGWLKEYDLKNVVVFDLYDILTGYGKSNWSMYGSDNGRNSHPSSEGNSLASKEFVVFLNKALNRKTSGTD